MDFFRNQDRSLWNKHLILEGLYYLNRAKNNQLNSSKYYLEALISSIHCISESYEGTNWESISFLYRQLEKIEPESISVKLNRIISESNFMNIDELISELTLLEKLIPEEATFAFYSSKAHLYGKLKKWNFAVENYKQALGYAKNETDKNYITEKTNLICSLKVLNPSVPNAANQDRF